MLDARNRKFQMDGARYSPKKPLPVLAFTDNHEDALPVQAGKIIKVWSLADDRFVLVVVGGRESHAFASGIASCCEALPDFSQQEVSPLLISSAAA